MKTPRSISRVVESFERLPGIGPKSASRLAYYLLRMPQVYLDQFAAGVGKIKLDTKRCQLCMDWTDMTICGICSDETRNHSMICVVEQSLDVVAIERSGKYKGLYHVLHGVIAPLEHIGPGELFIEQLFPRLGEDIEEIILALNPTMEGEATGMYLKQELLRWQESTGQQVRISRLAQGLPLGGDVEYADALTLSRALEGRREY